LGSNRPVLRRCLSAKNCSLGRLSTKDVRGNIPSNQKRYQGNSLGRRIRLANAKGLSRLTRKSGSGERGNERRRTRAAEKEPQ